MYKLIEHENLLQDAVYELSKQSRLSFDLEFDRDRHTYGFDLCLLQIGFDDRCLIIDPVPISILQPLFDFFENPSVQKLVHCPGEDLRLLHSLRCYPKNMADTEVMAKLLNYEQTSLAKLLELKCGVILNKKQQQSNWHRRPLHPEQLVYAADDVLYLPKLFDILYDEIREKKLEEWVAQEWDWLQTVRYTLEAKTDFLKLGDKRNLSPWHAFILNEMFLLRDRIAQRKNKPAYMIMPEESVRRLADGTMNYKKQEGIIGLHPSLRHGNNARELQQNIEEIFNRADRDGLPKKLSRNVFTEEERRNMNERKRRQDFLKDKIFAPVQKVIQENHGEFAARYILSNGWITKWLAGEVRWTDLQPLYKRDLVKNIASGLQIPTGEIEQYELDYFPKSI